MVAIDELGVINHVMLTVHELQGIGINDFIIVLMRRKRRSGAGRTNAPFLAGEIGRERVVTLPDLGADIFQKEALKKNHKKIQKTLALISGCDKVCINVRAARLEAGWEER